MYKKIISKVSVLWEKNLRLWFFDKKFPTYAAKLLNLDLEQI
jgi:hypothetical protein